MKKSIISLLIINCLFLALIPLTAFANTLFFQDDFEKGSGMWEHKSNYLVMENSCAVMPLFTSAGDSLFAMSELSGRILGRNYMVEFRVKIKDGCTSGIMINGATGNFSVLLTKGGFKYLPGGTNIYLAQLAGYPSGFTYEEDKWIDVRLDLDYVSGWGNKPTLYIKAADEADYIKVVLDYNLAWMSAPTNATLNLRSQGNVTEYDFIRIYTKDGSTCSVADPVITSLSAAPLAKTILLGESFYSYAQLGSTDTKTGYYTEWSIAPAGILEISGRNNLEKTIKGIGTGTAVVTVKAGNITKSITVTVNNLSIQNKSANLEIDEAGHKISPNVYGINDVQAWNIGRTRDFTASVKLEAIKSIKPWSIRGPGGIDGNYFLSKSGDLCNKHHSNFTASYGTSSSMFDNLGLTGPGGTAREGDYPPLTYSDIFRAANQSGVSYVYNMNIFSQSDAEIVSIISDIKSCYNGPVMIEMGNEAYDLTGLYNGNNAVANYITRCKEVNAAIKAVHPDVKTGIVIVPADIKERANSTKLNNWNKAIADSIADNYYDAVIPHIYDEIITNTLTESEMMRHMFAYNKNVYQLLTDEYNSSFYGKEYWITEWGMLPQYLLSESDGAEKARKQIAKSPGVAIAYFERMMDILKMDFVTIASYYTINDTQGFGLIQGEVKLPEYYAFKEIGELLDKYKYYYSVTGKNVDSYSQAVGMASGKTITMNEVEAWGLGNADKAKAVVFSNHSDKNMQLSLGTYKIRKIWSYGGIETNFPDYMNTGNLVWTGLPASIPLPNEETTAYGDFIYIEPYSICVAEIDDGSVLAKLNPVINQAGRVSAIDVIFEEDMDLTTLNSDNIKIFNTQTNEQVDYDEINCLVENKSLNIALFDALEAETQYKVYIENLKNSDGYLYTTSEELFFQTPKRENTGLMVVFESNMVNLAVSSDINLYFSEILNGISADSIKIKNLSTGNYIEYAPQIEGNRYIIKPLKNLEYNTQYLLEISENISNLNGARSFLFKTANMFDIYKNAFAKKYEGALIHTAVVRNNTAEQISLYSIIDSEKNYFINEQVIKSGRIVRIQNLINLNSGNSKAYLWEAESLIPLDEPLKLGE